MDLWPALGFRSNPYVVKPLPPSQDGRDLLVGRDAELNSLLRRVRESDVHVVLEGPNGVGKTSLVAVATWIASEDFRLGRSQQLYLPLPEPLQIRDDSRKFISDCYFSIARAFLEHEKTLKIAGRKVPRTKEINTWLNSPIIKGKGAGLSIPFGGFSGSLNESANSAVGFAQSGFQATIKKWLKDAFPEDSGGFVGLVDNLELLETSSDAQRLIEEIRDPVFQLPGTRWVVCGARGIARSVATTPRLNGVLSNPIDIAPVADEFIPLLIESRIKHYSASTDSRAPVSPESFEYIYDVSHRNLRDSLRYSQDFSMSQDSGFFLNSSEFAIREEVMEWLQQTAVNFESDITLQPRMWRLLRDMAEAGGSCSPGDHLKYGFNDRTHMRKNVVDLERYGLVISSREEIDQRRRSIEITSKGWLVHYAHANSLRAPYLPGM